MKRAIIGMVISVALGITAAAIGAHNSQRARIAELEHDNDVAFRLCGAVMCVPCNKGESGPQCQARMGERYEVIYYPAAEVFIAELRPAVEP